MLSGSAVDVKISSCCRFEYTTTCMFEYTTTFNCEQYKYHFAAQVSNIINIRCPH